MEDKETILFEATDYDGDIVSISKYDDEKIFLRIEQGEDGIVNSIILDPLMLVDITQAFIKIQKDVLDDLHARAGRHLK